ncbi:MAG: CHAD domain-containing protein [Hyphomicrobiales bacterium]
MDGGAGQDSGQGSEGPGDRSFGGYLLASARSIIADARQSITDEKLTDAEAVHDVRKALKRWRALMRLLSGPLKDQAERMRVEGRDLMRRLAGARDAQAGLDALEDLRKIALAADPPLSATSLNSIQKRLTDQRDAAEQSSFTAQMRESLDKYLDFAALSVERWPLPAIDFETVADGLTVTYRRAQKLMPDDWAAAAPDDLHDLRRRVVEHRHQMDLIEPLWPRLGKLWAEEAQRLRTRLGSCQDLAMLQAFTAPHQPLAPWRSRLAPLIAARRLEHLESAERLADRLFAEKPKAFRRRIAALWKARPTRQAD